MYIGRRGGTVAVWEEPYRITGLPGTGRMGQCVIWRRGKSKGTGIKAAVGREKLVSTAVSLSVRGSLLLGGGNQEHNEANTTAAVGGLYCYVVTLFLVGNFIIH